MVETTRWVRGSSKRDTSSHSQHLPTTAELSDIVGAEITMDDAVFVEVKQRDFDSLDGLMWELLAILSHV